MVMHFHVSSHRMRFFSYRRVVSRWLQPHEMLNATVSVALGILAAAGGVVYFEVQRVG
jgi:hypothetical protein